MNNDRFKFKIEKPEDVRTMTTVYNLYFNKTRLKQIVLTDRHIIQNTLPFSFRLFVFIFQFFCKHKWEKVGQRRMDGMFFADFNTFYQDVRCKECEKKSCYAYRSEF